MEDVYSFGVILGWGEEPLGVRSRMPVANECLGCKVRQYWEVGVGWKCNLLDQYLSNSSMLRLASMSLSPDESVQDKYVWMDDRRPFAVKEAYKLIRDRSVGDSWEGWRWIWRMKIQQRVKDVYLVACS